MTRPIKRLTAIEYFRDRRPWVAHVTPSPAWSDVEAAIRRMDPFSHPIVQLNCTESDDDENIFNLIGGGGRWTLLQMMGEWQYVDTAGGDEFVQLWTSDQGYECPLRHICADVEKTLRIARRFYDTGSYADLDQVT